THVFLTHRKTPWHRVSLAQRLRRVRGAAGVARGAKLYGLRHALGTPAGLRGGGPQTPAQPPRHTTTQMSGDYRPLPGQRAPLAEAMAKVNGPSTPPSDAGRPGS